MTLYLNINDSYSQVCVTLDEQSTLLNPYYVWQIEDADTNRIYYFTNDDISPAPYNYNLFSFSVVPGATYGATQGIIPATPGQYIYTVYESQFQYNLNIGSASDIVELGVMNISGTYSSIASFTGSNSNIIPTFKYNYNN